MANGDGAVNTVLAGGEEDENPIPGSQDDTEVDAGPGGAVGPTAGAGAPISTPPIAPAPSPVQVDSGTKVHPHMAILAGMLSKILGGIQNAPGNPRNAFDRGFMQASPNQQALQSAALSKAQSEADAAKMQVSMTGLKMLLVKHRIQGMDEADQNRYLASVKDFGQFMLDNGGEKVADGDKAGTEQQAQLLNQTDPRATQHFGKFTSWPLPTKSGEAPKFAVLFIPDKAILQHDYDGKLPDGREIHIDKGTALGTGGLPQYVSQVQQTAQKEQKDEMQEVAKTVGQNKMPDNQADAQLRRAQLNRFINITKGVHPQLAALAQDEINQINSTIKSLPATAQAGKLQEAREMRAEKGGEKKAGTFYHWIGSDGETRVGRGSEVPEGVEATPIGGEDKFSMYQSESHMSNIVQQSMNRIHQDIDEHPEIFDNDTARNIMATTTQQIDRSQAGLLVAGTGGSIPLPSGMGSMINTALQNNSLDPTTADALKNYLQDYKAMKDKALVMQMEMQQGKVGRGNAMAFKSITDQIPSGETADSRSAHRQMNDLQETQDELSKKYGNYGDFKKIAPYKPMDKGQSSTDRDRLKQNIRANQGKGLGSLSKELLDLPYQTLKKLKDAAEREANQ